MKQLKVVLAGVAFGMAIGMWFGVNVGREVPWYSNPFDTDSLNKKLKNATGETLERSGHALEKTGQALQEKLKQ